MGRPSGVVIWWPNTTLRVKASCERVTGVTRQLTGALQLAMQYTTIAYRTSTVAVATLNQSAIADSGCRYENDFAVRVEEQLG